VAAVTVRQRILVVSLNAGPDLTGIGKYNAEMAAGLQQLGWQVRTLAAPPYYPAWRVPAPWSAWRYQADVQPGGLVLRCPVYVPARPSGARRLLHAASFALSALPVLAWQCLFWRPQWVMVIEPPLASAPGALLAARLAGARTWLHVQDFEIDAAFNLGMLSSSRLRRLALAIERFLMRRFDRVSSLTPQMLRVLGDKGVDPARTVHFPNWVDTDAIHPLPPGPAARQSIGLPPDATILLYSGTMGMKQGLEQIVTAARRLQHRSDLHFVLCGEGPYRATLDQAALELPNLQVIPLQPLERLNALLNCADIHVLPQVPGAADLVMPSKLGGILASGRPFVATATPESAIGEYARLAGRLVPPHDTPALCAAICELADDRVLRERLGAAGRALAEARLARHPVIEAFERQLGGSRALQDQQESETRRP
jgi:colanic acid biosynthesis glycosyl transferase WcaI